MMIARTKYLDGILSRWEVFPSVLLIGPRQCGKTTIARDLAARGPVTYFDLENLEHRAALTEPLFTLRAIRGTIIIDEIQHVPGLFETIRVLIDEEPNARKFLFLGSASYDLLRQSSESLTGRLSTLEIQGFSCEELPAEQQEGLWLRGGLPRSYLAKTDETSILWRREYISSVLERDLPGFGVRTSSTRLHRAWMMTVHLHGATLNITSLSRSLDVSAATARGLVDVFTDILFVRQLQPWFANIGKRQRKSPKIYIRDSGLYHSAIGSESMSQLVTNPHRGQSWEGFVIEQLLLAHRPAESYYWATHQGAEIDLLMVHNGRLVGFEVKLSTSPKITASMLSAIESLKLERLIVVYPGTLEIQLSEIITAMPLHNALTVVI